MPTPFNDAKFFDRPLAPFQDEMAVYHDDVKDYSTNEPTMDGTASAVLMWSLLNVSR